MKVLVVGTGGSIVSGISTAADQMARTLPGMGYTAERITTGVQMRRRANRLNFENVRAVLADAVAVARRARRGKADVVWIHTFGMPTLPAARALAIVLGARVAGRPAVVHFHAFGLEDFVARGGRPLRLVVRALGRLAGALVVVHEAAAEALGGIAVGAPVHVLCNWVAVPDRPPPLPPQPPLRLVFVGGLVRRKGARQLIEAMRALDDLPVDLRLVGGAAEDGQDALASLQGAAADLVASGRVSFAGERDAEGVRAELRAGHLLVLPSEAEGMPIAMLEALAEGRPVLVTGVGGMRTVVEETGCGWILPDRQAATIATHVRRIADDPIGLVPAAAAAWSGAVARFSTPAAAARIQVILKSLTA
jgi:glycosyltransferase involved in cell wall biosynthesis